MRGVLFEPSRFTFEILKEKLRDHARQLSLVEAAVAEREGVLLFSEEPNAGETSSLLTSAASSGATKYQVKVTTLDIKLENLGFEHVDFLKIDAEGYDFPVLQGASSLLQENRIKALQFEYNSYWASSGNTLCKPFHI